MQGSNGSGFPLNLSAELVPLHSSQIKEQSPLFLQQNNSYFSPPDASTVALKILSDQMELMKMLLEQQQKKIATLEEKLSQQQNLNNGLILAFRKHEEICQVRDVKMQEELHKTTKSQETLNGRVLTVCNYFEKEALHHQIRKDAHHIYTLRQKLRQTTRKT